MNIYARWQRKNISLKKMKDFRSIDHRPGIGDGTIEYDGLCATQSVEYLWVLVDKTRWIHDIKDNRMGEIVIFEGIDTGQRCMDGHPIVKPTKIIDRIDGYSFWRDGDREKGVYQKVRSYLSRE